MFFSVLIISNFLMFLRRCLWPLKPKWPWSSFIIFIFYFHDSSFIIRCPNNWNPIILNWLNYGKQVQLGLPPRYFWDNILILRLAQLHLLEFIIYFVTNIQHLYCFWKSNAIIVHLCVFFVWENYAIASSGEVSQVRLAWNAVTLGGLSIR